MDLRNTFKLVSLICVAKMCGIAACIGSLDSFSIVRFMLIQIQHRGQEGAGIAWYTPQGIRLIKNFGLVTQAIPDINVKTSLAIGHVRYSTTGTYMRNVEELHPMYVRDAGVEIALAFNGTITNYREIRRELSTSYVFNTDTDTEVILKLVHRELRTRNDIVEAVRSALLRLSGSYSIVMMINNRLVIARDPLGFKPLSYAEVDGSVLVASESSAISTLTGLEAREVDPGEIIVIHDGEIERYELGVDIKKRAYCAFEYVYFSRPDTVFNGVTIYDSRKKMGQYLADLEDQDIDIVVPIPETGRIASYGYAQKIGRPIEDALIKVRYMGRSFIMPRELRSLIARFGIVRSVISSRRIALVDDSLVRGTTMRNIVKTLKNMGADKVHVRIASPPIRYPCFMGIDFPTREELIAHGKTIMEVCKHICADSLKYICTRMLERAIGKREDELCMACFTGLYPIQMDILEKEKEFLRR
ncbi:MAG: amidophosphoribosyltransferase [Crenarchaeota archaeon]|nr:amidophosphoribosyltransferase [Thermoproteota archaeon]